MDTRTFLGTHETGGARCGAGPRLLDTGTRWHQSQADLLFADAVLRSLRGGSTPSPRVLEWSGFVEHWMVVIQDDVCLLTGTVWRLPLSQTALVTPLLAIDPVAGWARVLDEWLTIGPPRRDFSAAGVHLEGVAERAARWLERKLRMVDSQRDVGLRN